MFPYDIGFHLPIGVTRWKNVKPKSMQQLTIYKTDEHVHNEKLKKRGEMWRFYIESTSSDSTYYYY